MKQHKLELIVTFAKLWGITTVDDFRDKKEIYRKLESYDSEELSKLLSEWADEFWNGEYEDTCTFFDKKMNSLILYDNGTTDVVGDFYRKDSGLISSIEKVK